MLTYCSTGNAHDSYWFRRSRDMVAGSVIAPRLDLTNEDLVRSHVHAIWLAETDQSMHSSITELVETPRRRQLPVFGFLPEIWRAVTDRTWRAAPSRPPSGCWPTLRRTWSDGDAEPAWWYEGWVHDQVSRAPPAASTRPSTAGASSTGPP